MSDRILIMGRKHGKSIWQAMMESPNAWKFMYSWQPGDPHPHSHNFRILRALRKHYG